MNAASYTTNDNDFHLRMVGSSQSDAPDFPPRSVGVNGAPPYEDEGCYPFFVPKNVLSAKLVLHKPVNQGLT
jgi:hypothetical protein